MFFKRNALTFEKLLIIRVLWGLIIQYKVDNQLYNSIVTNISNIYFFMGILISNINTSGIHILMAIFISRKKKRKNI